MFEVRKDEPDYALLNDPKTEKTSRYGTAIELIPSHEEPISLNINHDDAIGTNPNRNKQHGFHFTADNCIGCHACESACSEKNDLPAHLAFRSVGYVESGTFPDYTRMNISMACNHCEDPVCLKGCPTRAYTKHPEYGAVIQDPEICFGCGYCTWVCPYNAPQLDPVEGRVEKCNMCVDRLEVGLKPACVSACVGNALDFGVIENTPDRRDDIDTQIPGFPDPSISRPNIRFQQQKPLFDEVTRTDSMPVKYQKDESGRYQPTVDPKDGTERHWNISRLSSSENPLVLFTLSVQASLGIFATLVFGSFLNIGVFDTVRESAAYLPMILLSLTLSAFGLLMSVTHLGKPLRFYRGFNNWRHSPVCREGLGVSGFLGFGGLHLLLLVPSQPWASAFLPAALTGSVAGTLASISTVFAGLALISGAIGLYYMYRCYRIPARPFWNHKSTGFHFGGNALTLAGIVISLTVAPVFAWQGLPWVELIAAAMVVSLGGIVLESAGLTMQARDLSEAGHEGGASHYIQRTTFGHTYWLRNGLLGLNALLAATLAFGQLPAVLTIALLLVLTMGVLATALIGRALFYVLVIPTTMPGAFFWKNKAFVEHARDIGMDHMPNTGVVPARH
ncbi:Anaerobic dimethyl sulfoxide reductase chain B [BD1-7 clade bacterium]|uniref:Anaerobic dimethyl sulfoxide reductase chain B n=1 Tax=BD1-7 clade bacterium TaxID=2029982 RepID=A0A5S9R1U6_9GAMM|nr:Anaerobic dimethyl sulfoxide reductase chain B [BD1-7 clade bacterium]